MTDDNSAIFHPMTVECELPERLNSPFDYEPHPLCVEAARRVCDHVTQSPLFNEVMQGKMLGVLVCQQSDGTVGFLAAYSGQLGGREDWPWFVPAVFDYLQPDGYFKQEEAHITAINKMIEEKKGNHRMHALLTDLERTKSEAGNALSTYRQVMDESKRQRDQQRQRGAGDEAQRVAESQFQRAEWRRMKQYWRNLIEDYEHLLQPYRDDIDQLNRQRAERSEQLQRWLFDHFVMLNDRGERRTLTDIFATTPQRVPPAGTGECCAPKLLQYAFAHHLKPLAIAEFWQGASPRMEVRHHGSYYPACRGKCKPVLEWMLSGGGWSVEGGGRIDLHDKQISLHPPPSTLHPESPVYEDGALLIIDKPAGLLSVPGRTDEPSVESLLRERYGEVFMVHRLDQDTSGLMVVAKTREAHRLLQQQFLFATEGIHARAINKMYIALLDGIVEGGGTISFPLRPDINDRPRQMVDYQHGKEAMTEYEVLGHEGGFTRIALTPHTGRTHQLRVHCAHAEGLHTPIVGDRLYGRCTEKGQRLCLHAAVLAFQHPLTGERMSFSSAAPF